VSTSTARSRSMLLTAFLAILIPMQRALPQPASHQIVRQDWGCDSLVRYREFIAAAQAGNLMKWRKILNSGDCTTFWPGDSVILEVGPTGGLVRVRPVGAALSYYAVADAID
jgi:hypothetical protein